jgi:hypothetical protein
VLVIWNFRTMYLMLEPGMTSIQRSYSVSSLIGAGRLFPLAVAFL